MIDRIPTLQPGMPEIDPVVAPMPILAYLIAFFFSAVWLFSLGSILFFLYRMSPEVRHQLTATPTVFSLAIADLNGLLMAIAAWLVVRHRRLGAGLMLASTLLVLGLGLLSWPVIFGLYRQHPGSDALLRSLLLGISNLVVHIGATVYAFLLDRKGLLR